MMKNLILHSDVLRFKDIINDPIELDKSPDLKWAMEKVHKVVFGDRFNNTFELTTNIIEVSFGTKFDQPINDKTFPSSVKIVTFGENFNQPIDVLEDSNIECLIFDGFFKGKITKYPKNLKRLVINNGLMYQLENIPVLESLHINGNYNFPLVLKEGLKEISITDSDFNQSIDNLPDSIISIQIVSSDFDCDIEKLPKSLKNLVIYSDYNGRIYQLNDNIEYLSLLVDDHVLEECNFRENNKLKYLSYNWFTEDIFNNLPDSIKTVKIICGGVKKIQKFPKNLKYIELSHDFDDDLCNFPDNITTIVYPFDSGTKIRSFTKVPKSLKKIYLPRSYNGNLSELPDTVEEIVFDNYCICNTNSLMLPKQLKSLTLPKKRVADGIEPPLKYIKNN